MTKVTIRFSPELAEDIRLSQSIFEHMLRHVLNENLMPEAIPNGQRIIEGKATPVPEPVGLLESGKPWKMR